MFVSGQAERFKADGAREQVGKGMTLLEGDRIKTAANSHVYVRLRDGGLLVVRPASELHVDLWRYDPARPQDSMIKYTLDNGVARHVSGQGAKAARDKFRFNTPMAAIGVRGTDFTVLADPGVTRVSVQSGGVIVNALGGGCRADGVGPCEGNSAVELFASARDKLLQLRQGERRPELIDDVNTNPDHYRPPAVNEPTAQKKAPADADIVAESRTSGFVNMAEKAAPPVPAPAPPPVSEPAPGPAPAPAPVPVPEAPKPSITIADWGRWAPLAKDDVSAVDITEFLKGRQLVAINRTHVLATNGTSPVELPNAGVASFKLFAHDGVLTDTATLQRYVTTASDASLRIDFGTRRFDTSMVVSGNGMTIPIEAKGAVQASGSFVSDAFTSPSAVQGIVGGKQASEAVYLYSRSLNGFEASGAAAWLK